MDIYKDNIDTFKLDRNYILKLKLLIQKHLQFKESMPNLILSTY
jgi:hypothetical protein